MFHWNNGTLLMKNKEKLTHYTSGRMMSFQLLLSFLQAQPNQYLLSTVRANKAQNNEFKFDFYY